MPSHRPSHAALAALLRGLSLDHGITSQRELSTRTGIDEGRISKWARGEVYISRKSREKLARFFRITHDEFMERAWRVHRAITGEPEPAPEPDFEGAIEIAGHGERVRVPGVSREGMKALVTSAEAMARPDEE